MAKKPKTNYLSPKSMDDNISKLPQVLLQQIQNLLSPKRAARTAVLSEAWRNAWSQRPNIDLDEYSFKGTKHEFLSLLRNTLQGHYNHRLRIKDFRLLLSEPDAEFVSLLDHWIPILVIMGGINSFHLSASSSYNLPHAVFVAKSIVQLSVNGCRLNYCKVIKCKHLKVLRLSNVYIKDDTFQRIISTCISIEDIELVCCEGLIYIKLDKLQHLKRLHCNQMAVPHHEFGVLPSLKYLSLENAHLSKIFFCNISSYFPSLETLILNNCQGFQYILRISSDSLENFSLKGTDCRLIKGHIDAPNLSSFEFLDRPNPNRIYFDGYDSITNPSIGLSSVIYLESIKIRGCSNWFQKHEFRVFHSLKYLSLEEVCLHEISLSNFSIYFPRLQKLKFTRCYGLSEKVRILSYTLKHISLKGIEGSIMASIEAPNILSFKFSGDIPLTFSFAQTTSKWKSKINLRVDDDSLVWLRLNEMLKELSQSEISLNISEVLIYDQPNNIVRYIEPVEVEELSFSPQTSSTAVVNGFFFICRPRNVKVYWHGNENNESKRKDNEFAEYICKILMENRESTVNQEFSWQNDLKEATLNIYDDTLNEWRPLQYGTSCLRQCALPYGDDLHKIRFTLEWRDDQCW